MDDTVLAAGRHGCGTVTPGCGGWPAVVVFVVVLLGVALASALSLRPAR